MNIESLYLEESLKWVKGAIYQGERLRIAYQNAYVSWENDLRKGKACYSWNGFKALFDTQSVEEELFVFALQRALFYLELSAKFFSECAEYISLIDAAVNKEHIKNVRDMRTHANEYYEGVGRKKDKFLFKPHPALVADATSTIIINGHYLIGGRLDAFRSVEVLESILPRIEIYVTNKLYEISENESDHDPADATSKT